MALPVINPTQILDSYRKSDAVLIVCQNNAAKAIEIAAINEEAARMLGFSNEELVGKPLSVILPARISEMVADFTEYEEEEGSDLSAVLGKVSNFSVKDAQGRERAFKLRVIRGESIDRNPWFHLVLVNEEDTRQNDALREMLSENFKGHEVLNEQTGLADRGTLLRHLELVAHHVRNKGISAAFAIIDINHYGELMEQYGVQTCLLLHRHIGQICKQKLRVEDAVGTLSERSLGIVLVDAAQEPARMVLNRLRWAIGVSPLEIPKKKDVVAQVNVSFSEIDGRIAHTEILERCEAYSKEQRAQASNAVQLVVTHERRGGEQGERRRAQVPVEVDRRRNERRKL